MKFNKITIIEIDNCLKNTNDFIFRLELHRLKVRLEMIPDCYPLLIRILDHNWIHILHKDLFNTDTFVKSKIRKEIKEFKESNPDILVKEI